MYRFLFQSLTSFAIVTYGLPQAAPIDPADPNASDPTTVPGQDFALPDARTPEPPAIKELPDGCDPTNFSQDCITTLDNDEQGAYLWFEKGHGCTDDEQKKLKYGLWDAQDMLKYAAKWGVERSSRDVVSADYWMGPNWREYQSRIKGNLGRASEFINNKSNKKNYITITCKDPKGYCKRGSVEGGKVIGGYAWDYNGWFGYYGHINMCSPYYDMKDISGKIDDLNQYRKDGQIERLQDMRYFQTYGQFLAHEMMHLRSTYNPEPKIEDKYLWGATGDFKNDVRAYGPKRVHQLAKGDATGSEDQSGGKVSTINADSYALLMNSIFWWDVTQYFPGVPGRPEGSPPPGLPPPLLVFPSVSLGDITDTVSITSAEDQLDKAIDSYLVSDDIEPATPVSTSTPSPTTAPPVPDKNECHGISGDYWVMSRDIAVSSATEFCAQSEHTKKYNVGSVNELELSVRNLADDSKAPTDAPDCAARFQNAVIDGCDGNDAVNNPHNYKFGGTLTTGDGWEYKMTPLSQQVNEVACDVSYKFFYDGFEIRGKNLPDAKFGAEGEGLKDQVAGCGAITKWNFERTPNDCCFQWYASGQLPIGTKACVGRALMSAGGSGVGNCHGSGKRGVDYIDTWPGYGDEGRHVFGNSTA
ncbi:hypothetical protein EJ05DRAFT_503805 [Pseudovirgaria hyperparasitica]|uniref:Uncharacterized protein n=1 Tax=Pseudovirgaria hyperparasitica TaxID=470096 RepID=A0A6A6VXB0_9PEZI|nr:uncharacterized protein EJ05DRAFT_503805 [Pseudovirgaria hyperparasitica]KAF2754863.1 hypothetical protein EJ05DRAFT_503805 [Pseudovirgaria hyperparasitica]